MDLLRKIGKSTIPIIFWYLSIFGGIGLLIYAIFRKDPVIIVGQMFGIFIYTRNLILIYRKKKKMLIKNYINGEKNMYFKKTIDVFDPSKGEKIAKVVLSNEEDFNLAIKSSKKSQIEWSNTTPLKRSRIISKYKELIEANLDELAKLVCIEHGKTFEDAKGSVTRGLEVVEFACGSSFT